MRPTRCDASSPTRPSTAERVREVGTRGEGGDRTLVIDADAEEAVFRELEALHDEGLRFTAVSEERGTIDFGDPDTLVVIDPIDGSVNAKRGLPHHSISIAVAERRRRWPTSSSATSTTSGPRRSGSRAATRARGSTSGGCRSTPASAAGSDGRLELLGIESADPRWVREAADAARRAGLPAARARDDGLDALPGRRGAARRHGHAAALPRGRRRRRAADRARGGRPRGVPLVRRRRSARRSTSCPTRRAWRRGPSARWRSCRESRPSRKGQTFRIEVGCHHGWRDRLEARHHRRRGHRRPQARPRGVRLRARRRADRGVRPARLRLHRPDGRRRCRTPSRSTGRCGSRAT